MERLPGFRDFYPEPLPNTSMWSADVRTYIFDTWRKVARNYGFREYDGPPLEPLELFTTKSGEEIVGQLYNFTDKGNREISLRPEMTPTLARMVGAHERNYKKPIKWFAIPQLFRYERQQKGRLREHFQFNADLLGETDPAADAELISLLIDVLRALGLTEQDFIVRLSSRQAWHQFYTSRCQDAAKEYEFYQIIDKLEREDPAVSDEKLKALGLSLAEIKDFINAAQPTPELQAILNHLAACGLRSFVKVDYNVIRGLAYYTGTVFEAFDQKGEFRAIAGGGRYDHLVELITGGKVKLSAIGFGMGDVVLTELLKSRGLLPKTKQRIDAFCLIEDETLRQESLGLIHQLRSQGIAVEYSLTVAKSDKQYKKALDCQSGFTIKVEKNESGTLQVRCKNIGTRAEQVVPMDQVALALDTK